MQVEAGQGGRPLSVLLIDDNPDDRALVSRELRKEFAAPLITEVSREAELEQALEAADYDLVITDYQLRWTTGLMVLERVKARNPDCPVIMFTGTGSEEIAVEAMKAGLSDYVLKDPRHYRRLSKAVRSLLLVLEGEALARESQARYSRLFKEVPVGLYRATLAGAVTEANPALLEMFACRDVGELRELMLAGPYLDAAAGEAWQRRIAKDGLVTNFEMRLRRCDGHALWVSASAKVVTDEKDRPAYLEGAIQDISERKAAEELERDRNRVLEMIARSRDLNDVLVELCGLVEAQLSGGKAALFLTSGDRLRVSAAPSLPMSYRDLLENSLLTSLPDSFGSKEALYIADVYDHPAWSRRLAFAKEQGIRACWSLPILSGAGQRLGNLIVQFAHPRSLAEPDKGLLETAAQLAAIAIEQRQLADRLAYQAQHDPLTGLPNRTLMHDRLEQALAQARRGDGRVALMLLDLDDFKTINDTLGHSVGDELLKAVAERLTGRLREGDTVARLGGDEFVLVLPLSQPEAAARVADDVLAVFARPFSLNAQAFTVTPSLGVSLFPDNGNDGETLLKLADAAMYRAKRSGKRGYRFSAAPAGSGST